MDNEWMDEGIGRWMNERWIDGWVTGWMDGWLDEGICRTVVS